MLIKSMASGLTLITIMAGSIAQAEVRTSSNTLSLGHIQHISGTLEKSPNKFNLQYLRWDNRTTYDWGNFTQFLQIDNPFKHSDNQSGEEGITTGKHWVSFNYHLGDSPFHLWTQNYLVANEVITEDNFYYGLGIHGGNPRTGLWNINAGLHYVMGRNPFGESLHGHAGEAFAATYVNPFQLYGQNLSFIFYTEGFRPNRRYREQSFSGSHLDWDTLGKGSIGYLASTSLRWNITNTLSTTLTYKNQSNYGGYSSDTNHIIEYRIGLSF
ncbi:hypothetical protein LY622_14705 [Halomonas sp. M5N1S17]|uniref:outer membrane protein OmpK n=1 Tax=Halomonas alkalisoli TaxID=2907158 RepID=UPI001F3255E9|nr:outer membrane protein OmpK [Halomonas alkalisoli]MCE9664689.1 hypothetical protein [Halomonas alkalisoli]